MWKWMCYLPIFLIEKKMSEETQDLQPLKRIQIRFVQDLLLIYTGDMVLLPENNFCIL